MIRDLTRRAANGARRRCNHNRHPQLSDKDFAAWAPAEGDAQTGRFVQWFRTAQAGDPMPGLRRSQECYAFAIASAQLEASTPSRIY